MHSFYPRFTAASYWSILDYLRRNASASAQDISQLRIHNNQLFSLDFDANASMFWQSLWHAAETKLANVEPFVRFNVTSYPSIRHVVLMNCSDGEVGRLRGTNIQLNVNGDD